MNCERGLLCADSTDACGEFPVGVVARRLEICDTVALLDGVAKDSRGCAAGCDESGPSDRSNVYYHGEHVPNNYARRYVRNSFVTPRLWYGGENVVGRISLKNKCQWLRDCTEELGAESISCSAMAELSGVSEFLEQVFLSNASEVHVSLKKTISVDTSEETCSSSSEFNDLDRVTPRGGRAKFDRPREFPPPLPSLVGNRSCLKSFKTNGRLVLQRVKSPSRNNFGAIRIDGRLKLVHVSPMSTWNVENEEFPLSDDTQYFPEEDCREDIVRMEGSMAEKANFSLPDINRVSLISCVPPCLYLPNPHARRGAVLNPKSKAVLYDFCKRSPTSIVSDENTKFISTQFISTYNQLPADWQLPYIGSPRAGLKCNVGEQLAYSDCRSHRRGSKPSSVEVLHGFAVLRFNPFNLLILYFQRHKGGFKVNGLFFKDAESEGENGGIVELIPDNRFGNCNVTGRGKEGSISFHIQQCRSQVKEDKVGFETSKGLNYFALEKVGGGKNQSFPTMSKGGN